MKNLIFTAFFMLSAQLCFSAPIKSISGQNLLTSENVPTQDMFQNFWQAYEGLMGLLHRLEKDSLLGDLGIDPITGLRSSKEMKKDLERELERRSRRGQPFCIALTCIDGSDNLLAPAASLISLNVSNKDIADLAGIQGFTELFGETFY